MSAPVPPISPTSHSFIAADARGLSMLGPGSVDLVVTSPPYPMIAMWDEVFRAAGSGVGRALDDGDGSAAFTLMHAELDQAWDELLRVVKPGGFVCLNIGDATRTIGGVFRLYPNHSRVEQYFTGRGADVLPRIIWRKSTNAPNKFMGSGVLPAGAYVTLEHEYILVIRLPGKRDFSAPADKERRRRSALFWEERNAWYSDLWELGGKRQALDSEIPSRARSGAFPFEIPRRLIAMYSLQGDVVLDPFAGTGTTALAAAALGRHSLSVDLDPALLAEASRRLAAFGPAAARLGRERIERHREFIAEHEGAGKTFAHRNAPYGFKVKTAQERELVVPAAAAIESDGEHKFHVEYAETNADIKVEGRLF
ncbi:MAG: site-specific DNA-methyltransferase [Spirochaetales bacterium]|nr:site-specific DNA-methyltransferase [Spirochaetales bacterium]